MDLNKLKIFKCVADVGQINESASILKMAASNISQSLSAMERELGCKIFTRHYKGVRLTDEGKLLYESTIKILEEYSFGLSRIRKNHKTAQETLEISTSFGISSSDWFVRKMNKFIKMHPNIHIKMSSYKDGDVDCFSSDVILCPYIFDRPDLIQTEIEKVKFKLFASKEYLKKNGTPKNISELDKHYLIAFSKKTLNPFNDIDDLLHKGRKKEDPRDISFEVDNSILLMKLVRMGLGIGVISEGECLTEDFFNILPEEYVFKQNCLIFKKKYKNSEKIQKFKDVILS
jgi:DNA-binding transcriptional LysR family regulator